MKQHKLEAHPVQMPQRWYSPLSHNSNRRGELGLEFSMGSRMSKFGIATSLRAEALFVKVTLTTPNTSTLVVRLLLSYAVVH